MKTKKTPSILAINDICGLGRCSLSVIMPVISAMNVQALPLPTAVLSSHTGGFGLPSKTVLTEQLESSIQHYLELKLKPNAVYTGYFTDIKQIKICIDLFKNFDEATIKIVDPVMADNGKLYTGFDNKFVEKMREFIKFADIIVPNITEAALLAGEIPKEIYTISDILNLLEKLSKFVSKNIIITGVSFENNTNCNIFYDVENSEYKQFEFNKIPCSYPGTGDIFASVLISSILNSKTIEQSISSATDFIEFCVKTTFEAQTPVREGILLECCLPKLSTLA